MKKLVKKLSVFLLIIGICLPIALISLIGKLKAVALQESKWESKIYSSATLQDEFDGNNVIVILDKSISGFNKIHKDDFFGDFEKVEVKDIFQLTTPAARTGIDEKEFRQIYKITLPFDSRENVLQVIAQLEKIDGILCAEPNYYRKADTVPNDPEFLSGNQWGLNGTYGINATEAWA
jgi:hypothetical protein